MTGRRFVLLCCIAAIKLALLLTAPAHGSEVKRLRRETQSQLRLVRAQGRAAAGYPGLQTAANVTRIGVNISGLINPVNWLLGVL